MFRQRRDPQDMAHLHRFAVLPVGPAVALGINQVAVLHNGQRSAGQLPFPHESQHRPVELHGFGQFAVRIAQYLVQRFRRSRQRIARSDRCPAGGTGEPVPGPGDRQENQRPDDPEKTFDTLFQPPPFPLRRAGTARPRPGTRRFPDGNGAVRNMRHAGRIRSIYGSAVGHRRQCRLFRSVRISVCGSAATASSGTVFPPVSADRAPGAGSSLRHLRRSAGPACRS